MKVVRSVLLQRDIGSRRARHWRSRPLLLHITSALIVLVILSFAALLWSASYKDEEAMSGEQYSFLLSHWVNKKVGADSKIQIGRPPARSSGSPAEKLPSGGDTIWFSPNIRAAGAGNTSELYSVFESAGNVRIALPSGVGEDTVTCAPRIFAFLAPWRTYERSLATRGAYACDTAAIADVNEELQASSRRSLVPVKHIEVRLVRQRKSRNAWVVPTEATLPIVGILPRELTTLVYAEELLVKSDLRQDGLVSLVAAVQPDSVRNSSMVVGIDTHLRASAAKRRGGGAHYDTGNGTVLIPSPLLEFSSVPSYLTGPSAFSTAESSEVSPGTTLLKWRTGSATATSHREALELILDIAHPGRPKSSFPLHAKKEVKMRPGSRDNTYTAALEATVCSARIVRLYGLSASLSSIDTHGGFRDKNAAAGGPHGIQLNMSEEVEMVIGSEAGLSSGGAPLSGVVPLLYVELSNKRGADAKKGAQNKERQTVGLLWLHSGSFFVSTFTSPDPTDDDKPPRTCVRLRGTAGATSVYLLPGPTPAEVLRQYYTLVGFPTLPPRFLLGYHHGLQGAAATTEQSVENLSEAFLTSGVPLDSVWISSPTVAAGDTPFTWNHTRFPDPLMLQSNLWYRGRRYVVVRSVPTIPKTTRSPLFLEGRRQGFFVSISAEETAGWSALSVDGVPSHVVDFFNPMACKWYGGMLKYHRYVGSSNHTFITLQHSTPAVLTGSALGKGSNALLRSLPRSQVGGEPLLMDLGHYGGLQHRQVHQLLALQFARAAHDGMLRRTFYHRRALIFTESYFAGTQQYAVVRVETQPRWTDAVQADPAAILTEAWRTLHRAVCECAQLGMLGIPFSGANLAGGLVSRLLLLAKMPSNTTTPSATAAGRTGEHGGNNTAEVNAELMMSPDASGDAIREMEELLVRWYQAGVFFGAMYADESAAAADAPTASGVNSSQPWAAAPWWTRWPVAVATRQAIHANLHARYALLPYLYTSAYHASEEGSIFLAPLAFASSEASPPHEDTTAQTCYATGSALIVCPVTQPVHPPQTLPRSEGGSHINSSGFFDFWTGTWHGASSSVAGGASSWAAVAQNRTPASQELAWLAASDDVPLKDLPAATSVAPVFLRSGHIVATQNVIASRTDSTHVGSNWTFTVALPPLPTAGGVSATLPVLLAEGDVFWDEGSHNSQSHPPTMKPGAFPPPDMPRIPTKVNHCELQMKCFYEEGGASAATARLTVEVAQTSESCPDALGELVSHWNEEPRGFHEYLMRANARRDARLHQLGMEQEALEDKGLRRDRDRANDLLGASRFTPEDLRGLRLPDAHNESTRDELWNSHLLQRFRFLFQRPEDAARLAQRLSTSTAATVFLVERRSSTGGTPDAEIDENGPKGKTVRASHDGPDAHAIVVDMTSAQQDGAAAASVFGARKVVLSDGSVTVHVPPRHTWRFTFSLK
ncbi:hypothetical protein JKF63_00686 [Porcisia hertigi]|uniref:Glycoside hydrolase family 31 TIM barrel domain-containing protein n=1 Tax=Porcisia hertigi TaxID=2761500 RepID=A0A836KXA8_9TRYP|nr:hypothetical protein JKF63_00686 [Porcisia hertigi]